jgi:catechol 2,3-dioxygenase-like lactoylglutathione lyase family enzyme
MRVTEIVFTGYPVTNLKRARKFYEGALGLTVSKIFGDENKAWVEYEVLLGKECVAQLAESSLLRICRVLGGGTFSRRSPYGHWFEDVRALGFLRPPWGLAYDLLFSTASIQTEEA